MPRQYHFWPGEGGMDAWDVDRLVRLAAGLPYEEVALGDLPEIDSEYWFDEVERPTVRKVTEHFRRVAEADLSYPVILGPGNRVMDGMHRVARALGTLDFIAGKGGIVFPGRRARPRVQRVMRAGRWPA
jgi:hypothetical protein